MSGRRLVMLVALVLMVGTVAGSSAADDEMPARRRGRTFRADTRPGHDWQRRDDPQGEQRVLRQDGGSHTYWGTTRPYWGTMQPYWGGTAPRVGGRNCQ